MLSVLKVIMDLHMQRLLNEDEIIEIERVQGNEKHIVQVELI